LEVPLLPPDVENVEETVHLIGTPPLAVPEHPEEYVVCNQKGLTHYFT
jgi:hypothetical protein